VIRPIHSSQVLQIWPDVIEYLRKVPLPGYRLEDVLAQLLRQEAQLWVAGDPAMAAVVTELQQLPTMKVCAMWLCGGENMLEWWEPMESTIRSWAEDNGCSAVEIIGRPGWEKLLGYRKTHSVMRLELDGQETERTGC